MLDRNQCPIGFIRRAVHLDAPSFLQTQLPHPAMYQAAASGLTPVDQRYSPKLVLFVVGPKAQDGMERTILENVSNCDS